MQYNTYSDKTLVRFALTNDTPYLTLTGKLWGAFHELYTEKLVRYIKSTLYNNNIITVDMFDMI